jgi:hypothetical protein
MMMADERLMRERAKEVPKQHEIDYWEEVGLFQV